jgi:hypothetical protein
MVLKDSNSEGVEVEAEFTLSIYFQSEEGSPS